MINSTLCYLERGDSYLMLHRVKKKDDMNHDKWIGVGGKFEDKESFTEEIRHSLMYYFWCKSEYEVTVYPWPARSAEDFHIKVDIFEQVNMNWQAFIDYVWEHRKEVKL